MYIHISWTWRFLGILGHLFQVGLAILATYIGNKFIFFLLFFTFYSLAYTRISDYQHHWHDVLFGAIVGSLIAFVAFKFILNWYNYATRFLPYTVRYQGGNVNYRRMNEFESIRSY